MDPENVITIYTMTVQDLIEALQELVAKNPLLAYAGVSRTLQGGGDSTPIVKLEAFSAFGYIKFT